MLIKTADDKQPHREALAAFLARPIRRLGHGPLSYKPIDPVPPKLVGAQSPCPDAERGTLDFG
jgi:hypothetical protein